MRRLTLSISEPLAGRQVRTLLRRELGLSAAGVRRARTSPMAFCWTASPSLPTSLSSRGKFSPWPLET
ncbi:MAG: hypothetical protein ACLUNZ_04210 [Evtepia sp.]